MRFGRVCHAVRKSLDHLVLSLVHEAREQPAMPSQELRQVQAHVIFRRPDIGAVIFKVAVLADASSEGSWIQATLRGFPQRAEDFTQGEKPMAAPLEGVVSFTPDKSPRNSCRTGTKLSSSEASALTAVLSSRFFPRTN